MNITKIVRKNILNLKPYSSARNEYTGNEGILLDANENSFGSVTGGTYHRYPDPLQKTLKEQIAIKKGLSLDQIFLGNGSDEAIDLLIRAFCEPEKEEVLIFPPTYGMYKVCADINNVFVRQVPLKPDFTISKNDTMAGLNPRVKIIFLCSPNNPTGNLIDKNEIISLLSDKNRLIVVDEAYIDFSGEPGLLDLLSNHDNLVILQTFSKSWGLAGIRLGMAFGHPEIISVLNKIKYPYNINLLTQEKALQVLSHPEKHKRAIAALLEQRDYLMETLKDLGIVKHIFPSQANFILIRFTDAKAVFKYLKQNKIIVRDRSEAVHCENCLRITVGTPSENKQLITILKRIEG